MSIFLTMAFLFFIGSVLGWFLELFYRNLRRKSKKWINPGFCTGPYVPIYGFGLCTLFLLASLGDKPLLQNPIWNQVVVLVVMAIAMTLIELVAGIFCLKFLKVRLWDYSEQWGNFHGIICPAFSLAWAAIGMVYCLFVHPHILEALHWLSQNLAFTFFIGMFYGILIIDVAHSAQLMAKLKKFADENLVVLKYEGIKDHIRKSQPVKGKKLNFFRPFHSDFSLSDHLKEMYGSAAPQRKRRKKK